MTWATVPLKRVASLRVSNVDKKTVDGEQPVRLCNYTDVYYRDTIRPDQEFMSATASREQIAAFRLRPGDVVITKDSETPDDIGVPAYVEAGAPDLICGYHLALIRPVEREIDGRFLFWSMASAVVRDQLASSATGVTRFGLRTDSIGGVLVPLPTVHEQRAIADFLDAETARIGALIARKRKLQGCLEERFWSLVDGLVDANGAPTVRLTYSATAWCDGPFGSSLASAHYSDTGARVVRLGNIGRGAFKDVARAFISSDHFSELKRHEVRPSDLLVAGLGDERNPLGRACVAPDLGDAVVKADCFRFRLDEQVLLPAFAAWYLSSERGWARTAQLAQGSTRARANLGLMTSVRVPRPSLEQQRRSVGMIEDHRERLLLTQRALDHQLALMQERRQALITATVTDKLDRRWGGA